MFHWVWQNTIGEIHHWILPVAPSFSGILWLLLVETPICQAQNPSLVPSSVASLRDVSFEENPVGGEKPFFQPDWCPGPSGISTVD